MIKLDVICIGGGHASWPIAVELQKKGKNTLLIANDKLGGTCTSYGCDPKILLDAPFEIIAEANRFKGYGLKGDLTVEWEKLQEYNRKVISPLPSFLKSAVESAGVRLELGAAKLTGPHSVMVNGVEYYAEHIVVATGRRAATLDIPGSEYVSDSSEFLYLDSIPQRVTFIGAGIISLEFASMVIKMGREVTVIHNRSSVLPMYYDKFSQKIVEELKREGVVFHFEQTPTEVRKQDGALLLKTTAGLEIETDYILGGAGRVPNVDLGLEDAGVTYSSKGIPTDNYLRTNVPSIFASGDIRDTSIPRLTPTAFFEANYITKLLLGDDREINYPVVPHLVYTIPRIAQVGVTQKEAAASDEYHTVDFDYGDLLLFQTRHEPESRVSFILDKENYLVGADIYGDFAAELINFLTLIITQRFSAADLKRMVFAFPAHSSTLTIMALEGILKQD